MLAASFGEKGSNKHARNTCNVTNQNIIITCASITIVTAWSFILWQLIRQTKSNFEWFSCYKCIILETCALDQQPRAEILAKGHPSLKWLWGYYDVIMLLLQTLPSSYQYSFQPIIAVLRILYEGMIDKMQPDMSGFQKLKEFLWAIKVAASLTKWPNRNIGARRGWILCLKCKGLSAWL